MNSMRRPRTLPSLRPNVYTIFQRALEEGAEMAVTQMFKHLDRPLTEEDREHIVECIEREVMNAVCEVFAFPTE